ncbi:MAG: ribonuclease III [Blautia sp.]|nr:ribonuclease III [Blautia sp.]
MKPELSKLSELENRIDYHFHQPEILYHAMMHSSYANESGKGRLGSNERLEFLGDAVLEVVSSEFLYAHYPKLSEGELTKRRASMVCEPTLAICARRFELPQYLLLGKGEEMTGGRKRDSIISDATEALIGAIYLDGGFASAKQFILRFILNDIENTRLFYDSKTVLQELAQDKGESVEYVLVGETGPDHDKKFIVEAWVGGACLGCGSGHTKKAAEQAAASQAIQKFAYVQTE